MTETLIKCDFDGAMPRDLAWRIRFALGAHGLRPLWRCDRRTIHGWHVVIAVAGRVALWRVILLQAVLGSDWKREVYNSARVAHWRRVPPMWRSRINVLYLRHYRGVPVDDAP